MIPSRCNSANLCGIVLDAPAFSHTLYAEQYYRFHLRVPRLSGCEDVLPVTVAGRLLVKGLFKGAMVRVCGPLRSYNKWAEGKAGLCSACSAVLSSA